MIDRNLVIAKLMELDKRVRRVASVRRASAAEYLEDEPATELTSFNLMLAVQCATDVATHVIADQEWAPAATDAEALDRLSERRVISAALAARLRKAVGFRKAVAHGYAQLRTDLLHVAATAGLDDLVEFSADLTRWLTQTT